MLPHDQVHYKPYNNFLGHTVSATREKKEGLSICRFMNKGYFSNFTTGYGYPQVWIP